MSAATGAPPDTSAAPSARDREQARRLQAQLDALTRDFDEARAEIDRRRQALDAQAARAQADFQDKRRELSKKLEAARRSISKLP